MRIPIADQQEILPIDRLKIRRAIRTALRYGGYTNAEISVALVDDAAIHVVNRQFLGHDYPTDVISFPLSDSDELLEGELVVSTETALREAAKVGGDWTPECELLLYLIHGTLHLTGFDDHEDEDIAAMRRGESECLKKLGLPYEGYMK